MEMKELTLDRDRLSVLTGALLLALSMTRLLEVPIRPLGTTFLGSQLGFNLSATTIMPLIMLGLGVTAAESLVRSHPIARQGKLNRSTMYWIVPGLLVTALATWLVSITDTGLWTAGLLISCVLIPLALAAEYSAVNPDQGQRTILQWGQTVLIHLLAFIIFTRIYDVRARSLLSGTAVLLVTTLLAARIYWPIVGGSAEAFLYGVTAGVLLGLMTWVLNYWRLTSLQGGLLLLALFYVVVGLIQQYLYGRFNRQVVIEFGGVGVLALLVILIAVY
jgi:intracellular septation protein A